MKGVVALADIYSELVLLLKLVTCSMGCGGTDREFYLCGEPKRKGREADRVVFTLPHSSALVLPSPGVSTYTFIFTIKVA